MQKKHSMAGIKILLATRDAGYFKTVFFLTILSPFFHSSPFTCALTSSLKILPFFDIPLLSWHFFWFRITSMISPHRQSLWVLVPFSLQLVENVAHFDIYNDRPGHFKVCNFRMKAAIGKHLEQNISGRKISMNKPGHSQAQKKMPFSIRNFEGWLACLVPISCFELTSFFFFQEEPSHLYCSTTNEPCLCKVSNL